MRLPIGCFLEAARLSQTLYLRRRFACCCGGAADPQECAGRGSTPGQHQQSFGGKDQPADVPIQGAAGVKDCEEKCVGGFAGLSVCTQGAARRALSPTSTHACSITAQIHLPHSHSFSHFAAPSTLHVCRRTLRSCPSPTTGRPCCSRRAAWASTRPRHRTRRDTLCPSPPTS